MLKKIIKYGAMLLVVLFSASGVLAQEKITEGTITITYAVDSFRMSKPSAYNDVKIYFKDGYLKVNSDYTMLGRPEESSMICQPGQSKVLFLTKNAGMKVALSSSEEDYTKMLEAFYSLKVKLGKLDLHNAMLINFNSTGQKEQVGDYICEKYKADMSNGENLTIWTTEEIVLPFNFLKYEVGSLGELLKGKKIKGTLLRLQYGNKLEANLKVDTQKIATISMVAPEGYTSYDLRHVLGGILDSSNNN